ncbi:PilZ domain-containing protein [Saccharospirillum mangrovi]|uniref:PilZ domain-containing protein n=1 Tax=Saccharospirillum mangrovi TaxID=2161747 RepID=UPI0013007613|nr:PilZ domain-containing protein [Saccharospirillum mangrovi]
MDSRRKDRTRFIYRLRAEAQDDQGRLFNGHLVDVTLDGMMLIGNASFDAGTRLALTVDLPHNTMGNGQMAFYAQVRWCDHEADPDLYALGLSLEDMSAQSRQTLEELMVRFHESSTDAADEADDSLVQNRGGDPFVHGR